MNKELALINSVCKNKDISVLLANDVDDLFTAYKDVWGGLRSYYNKYRQVPDITVLQERYEDLDIVEVKATTESYLDDLKNEHLKSRIQDIMMKAASDLDSNAAGRTYEKLVNSLGKLSKFTNNARDLNVTDIELAERHFTQVRERASMTGGTPGIPTGFKSIDAVYPTGMAPGHLIYAIGYSGKAKTWFTSLLAVKAWEQGFKPMIVSLEMSPENMRERIYTLMGSGHFNMSDLARGDVNTEDLHAWGEKRFNNREDFIVVSNDGINDVTPNVIQGFIDRHRPDIVILDYAQLFSDNRKSDSLTPRMFNLSREIKLLAGSNNIPIIVISAVTEDDSSSRESPPILSQVAWSKAMEYDADMAFAVHKHDDSELVEIAGRKNRHGPLFGFYFEADLARGIWNEKYEL